MLEDAEVKAPRRVWRAVSDRLDGAAAPAAAGTWWAWGAAFAAAALAAVLVVPQFFKAPTTQDPIALLDREPAAVAALERPSAGDDSATPQSEQAGPAVSFRKAPATVDAAPCEPADAPETVETANPAPAADAGEPAKGTPASDPYDYDRARRYWASVDRSAGEDNAAVPAGRKMSLYAGGFVGTNDSGFASNRGRSLMSPAYGPAQSVDGLTETSASTYGIPFTIGLGVRIPVFNRVSVGAGLSYSLLERSFTGDYVKSGSSVSGDVAHRMQYVGIPVNIFYDIIEGYSAKSPVRFYAYGGGQVEKCISNRYIIRQAGQTVSGRTDGLQWSVAAGLGVEFKVAGPVSLYVDPSVRYYFYNGQPKSLRTEKPFMASFEAGLRFNL